MSSVSSSSFTGMGPWTPVSKTNSDTIDQAAYNISSEEYMQLKSDLKKRKKYLMVKNHRSYYFYNCILKMSITLQALDESSVL